MAFSSLNSVDPSKAIKPHAALSATACSHWRCSLFRPWASKAGFKYSKELAKSSSKLLEKVPVSWTEDQTQPAVEDTACHCSFHQCSAPWAAIEDGRHFPIINHCSPQCDRLGFVPKQWNVTAVALGPVIWRHWLARRLWTLDCGLRQNLGFLQWGDERDFCTGPEGYSRIGSLVGAFFAASSELLLLVRLDLAPADWAQNCNGFDLLGWQGHLARSACTRRASTSKNHVTFSRMILSQNAIFLSEAGKQGIEGGRPYLDRNSAHT